jgi:hypothetical protein
MFQSLQIQFLLLGCEFVPLIALFAAYHRTGKAHVGFIAAAWIVIVLSHAETVLTSLLQSFDALSPVLKDLSDRWQLTLSLMSSALLIASASSLIWPNVKSGTIVRRVGDASLPIIGLIAAGLNSYVTSIDDFTSTFAVGALAMTVGFKSWSNNPSGAAAVAGIGLACALQQPLWSHFADSNIFTTGLTLMGALFGLSLAWAAWDSDEKSLAIA